ncbi:MAG: OmpA family protein [Acidobacteria bacterium]|nr:OmpA family protein [Acidobacteriota bacterium]MDA1236825.1 OmpA family protein [Acidobacteriota bacterium]
MKTLSPNLLIVGALGMVIAISGCATKKFVRDTVSPVETKVGEVDQRTTQNTEKLGELDSEVTREVSRLDEQVSTALADARTADGKAVAAQGTADRAVARANEVETASTAGFGRIDKTLSDMSSYRQATMESVMFGFDSATLTEDANAQLGRIASATAGKKVFVVEVRGFTDSTGNADYNVRLSERRAEMVVRTLAAQHNIPLRSIHRVGLGEIEGESTREARQQNRRDDVTVFVPLTER